MQTKIITVDDHKFDIVLLNVKQALELEATIINMLAAGYQGKMNGAALYDLAGRLLNGAEVDNHPLDIDTFFLGKTGLLNKVIFACVKESFPDFFAQASDLLRAQMAAKLGAAKE